jgi:E3 ubiquitin-protein ligase HUWE1
MLKNNRFVEALEKIIMGPILIGSKNKDQFESEQTQPLPKASSNN